MKRHTIVTITLFVLAAILLFLNQPLGRGAGYALGSWLAIFISWGAIIGISTYFVRKAKGKDRDWWLRLFAIVLLVAVFLDFAVAAYKGYMTTRFVLPALDELRQQQRLEELDKEYNRLFPDHSPND